MAAIQKLWTSSADFDSGSHNNTNALTSGELRKTSNASPFGTWSAEYDAGLGSHPLWQSLTLAFDVQGTGSTLAIYARSSAIPGDQTGQYELVDTVAPGDTSPQVYGLSTAYGRRRYFQIVLILGPVPTTTPANCRVLSVQLDGQTTTPAASVDPEPLDGSSGHAAALAAGTNAAGARLAWA